MSHRVPNARGLASLLPFASAFLLLTGCASVTPIGQLLDNSTRYDGKTVRIMGEVKNSVGALGRGAYQVKDETGTLTVVTEQGSPPRNGSTIGVKGKFQALFTLGRENVAVLKEESRSQP
ncbi:MAG: hypothetical protein ACREMX_13530 [Gemmatimonadales bacterium]